MSNGTDGLPSSELGVTPQDMGVPIPEPAVNDELIARLREIDASITDRHVYSKFSGNVILHGRTLKENSQPARFEVLPDDMDLRHLDPTGHFGAIRDLVLNGISNPRGATELERLLGSSHALAVLTDKNNPELGTLQLIYPVEGVDTANRAFRILEVYLKMPRERLNELEDLLTQNPDAVEQFYQIATEGLDNSVQRRQASQAIGIELEEFMPAERFQSPNVHWSQVAISQPGQRKLNLDSLVVLKYTKPQGQVAKLGG